MSKEIIPVEQIAGTIALVRGQKVLLDVEVARLYGVTTGNLNKAVKRNSDRFPPDFMFQVTAEEAERLIFQIGISKGRGGRRHLPQKFAELDRRVGKHDGAIGAIIEAIRQLMAPPEEPRRRIGFHVQETPPRYRTRKVR